jgi:hypothetical protein
MALWLAETDHRTPGAFRTDFSGRSLRIATPIEAYAPLIGPATEAFTASQPRPRGLDPRRPQGARRGHQPRRHRRCLPDALIGPRTMSHLDDLLAGIGVTLSDDILDRIDEIVPPGTDIGTLDQAFVPAPLLHAPLRRRPLPERAAA